MFTLENQYDEIKLISNDIFENFNNNVERNEKPQFELSLDSPSDNSIDDFIV